MTVSEWIAYVDQRVWGPGMLVLLMGTGVFLTLRTRFLPWRNLGWALKSVLGRDSRAKAGGAGDVSPFSALMTTLAATIGTGNIVGVATALVAGGPGALVWMEISALFGLSSKCAECLLAVKYRQRDAGGEMRGGPMYTMCAALRWKRLGGALAFLFALFTVLASLGMGDMAQANSIAGALADSFSVPARTTGVAVALLALVVILGGIRRIAGVCSVVVPLMAVLYLLAGTAVLLGHLSVLPGAVAEMFRLAFSPAAAAGGAAGTMTASALNAARWGIARGCFSHEAGMGSAAIPAASAATDSPARQGYVNMTGVFFDTTVICTVTGLCICASGVLGTADASGAQVNGVALTALAFKTVLGPLGGAAGLPGDRVVRLLHHPGMGVLRRNGLCISLRPPGHPSLSNSLRPGGLSRRHSESGGGVESLRHLQRPDGSAQPDLPAPPLRHRRPGAGGLPAGDPPRAETPAEAGRPAGTLSPLSSGATDGGRLPLPACPGPCAGPSPHSDGKWRNS